MALIKRAKDGIAAMFNLPTWEIVDTISDAHKRTCSDYGKTIAERDDAHFHVGQLEADLAMVKRDLDEALEGEREAVRRLHVAQEDQEDLKRLQSWAAADAPPADRRESLGYYTLTIGGKCWGAYPNRTIAEKAQVVAERMGLGYGSVAFYSIVTEGLCPICGKMVRAAPNGHKRVVFMGKYYHTECLAKWDATLRAAREAQEVKA